jgi:hypothetical protein
VNGGELPATLTLDLVFTAAGAAAIGGFLAGVVEGLKQLMPGTHAHGRAPMLLAALLALLVVGAAAWDSGQPITPASAFVGFLAFWSVYTAAVGTHATVMKAARVVNGTTNPRGPDPGT